MNNQSRFSAVALLLTGLISLLGLAACGGGGSSNPTTPVTTIPGSTTTQAAQPTPTPGLGGTPFDCGRESLDQGPVSTYRFKLKAIRRDGVFIEGPPEGAPFPADGAGRIFVRVGDFLTFDSTQKNAGGNQCRWVNDPVWSIDDQTIFKERTDASRETKACGFLLRGDVMKRGVFAVDATLDGVDGETIDGRRPVLEIIAE